MQLLDELYSETKRIFIAGSSLAKGDPRITKYIPALQKIGEKAPIMKKLADKYTALTESGDPSALAEAGTMLYAVMATQGITEVMGESKEIKPAICDTLPETVNTHSKLFPVIEALSEGKQGRLDVLKEAYQDGLHKDLRLLPYLCAALDDKYSELCDYVEEKIIPDIGAIAIPFLLADYDTGSKRAVARRLNLLSQLDYADIEAKAIDAVENGEGVFAVAGVTALGKLGTHEEYLIALTNAKKAEIRTAALTALSLMQSKAGFERILEVLNSKRYEEAIDAAKNYTSDDELRQMLSIVKAAYECLLVEDCEFVLGDLKKTYKTTQEKYTAAGEIVFYLFKMFENGVNGGKRSQELLDFLHDILKSTQLEELYSKHKCTARLNPKVIAYNLLAVFPSSQALPIYDDLLSKTKKDINNQFMSEYLLVTYFRTAKALHTKERVYEIFAPYYKDDKLDKFNFTPMLNSDTCSAYDYTYLFDKHLVKSTDFFNSIDKRWQRLFIEAEDFDAMRALITYDNAYLEVADKLLRKLLHDSIKGKIATHKGKGKDETKAAYLLNHYIEIAATAYGEDFLKKTKALARDFYDTLVADNNRQGTMFMVRRTGVTNALRLLGGKEYQSEEKQAEIAKRFRLN